MSAKEMVLSLQQLEAGDELVFILASSTGACPIQRDTL